MMLWRDPKQRWRGNYDYSIEHPKRLMSMVNRHLDRPHRFVLATDDLSHDIDCQKVPLPTELLTLGHRWAKLALFHPAARQWFGDRLLYMDLDTVICGSVSEIISSDSFRISAATVQAPGMHYNSSMILMDVGARQQVWDQFDPVKAEALCHANGYGASDQFWIAQTLGDGERTWTRDDGVFQFRDVMDGRPLPRNARVVMFPGPFDPSMSELYKSYPWIKQHWQ